MQAKAIQTLDCANKVRIHYLLAQPVYNQLFDYFPGSEISVQEFSKLVQGAKDHFTLTIGTRVRATGVIGDAKLVVTYAKAKEMNASEDIAQFEGYLRNAGYDEIEKFNSANLD